jgi:hypothetical protein
MDWPDVTEDAPSRRVEEVEELEKENARLRKRIVESQDDAFDEALVDCIGPVITGLSSLSAHPQIFRAPAPLSAGERRT